MKEKMQRLMDISNEKDALYEELEVSLGSPCSPVTMGIHRSCSEECYVEFSGAFELGTKEEIDQVISYLKAARKHVVSSAPFSDRWTGISSTASANTSISYDES